jgi:hypothetical protein
VAGGLKGQGPLACAEQVPGIEQVLEGTRQEGYLCFVQCVCLLESKLGVILRAAAVGEMYTAFGPWPSGSWNSDLSSSLPE